MHTSVSFTKYMRFERTDEETRILTYVWKKATAPNASPGKKPKERKPICITDLALADFSDPSPYRRQLGPTPNWLRGRLHYHFPNPGCYFATDIEARLEKPLSNHRQIRGDNSLLLQGGRT